MEYCLQFTVDSRRKLLYMDMGSGITLPHRSPGDDGCAGVVGVESQTVCALVGSTGEAAGAVGEIEG